MNLKTYFVVVLIALYGAFAAPRPAEIHKRVIARAYYQDNRYRSFIDPKTSTLASSYCKTCIHSPVKTPSTITTTAYVTAGAAKRGIQEKRALAATTRVAKSHLTSMSSPISINLSSSPNPISTRTSSPTVIPTPADCTINNPIVKNGNFESGLLAPWAVTDVYPGPWASNLYGYGVTKNVYDSTYAFTVLDEAASTYFQLDLGQTLTLCPGQKYGFAASYFMLAAQDEPQTLLSILVDGRVIASSNASDVHAPESYVPIRGTFTAARNMAKLKVRFTAMEKLVVSRACGHYPGLDALSVL
ncbi:MAG: hypothetical protein Q9213_003673 [Squamulea squamosa]